MVRILLFGWAVKATWEFITGGDVEMGKIISFLKDEEGQTATEYMLIISVVVVAVVAAAYAFVPEFQQGVINLANDVRYILNKGCGKSWTCS